MEPTSPNGAAPDPSSSGPGDATGAATLELFRENDAYTELLWRRLSAMSPRSVGARVLEVGCGIGNLTRILLRSEDLDYLHALDMDPAYVERVRAEIDDPRLVVSTGLAEEFCPEEYLEPEKGFDCIVASNVIEHIEDDTRVLSNFRRLLRPAGVILILVPAHRFLYCSLDRHLSHYRRYRKRDLEALARRADLEPLRVRHFNPIGTLGWWLNGKVLRRSVLPAAQLSLYSRFALPISDLADRWNPFPLGISLLASLERTPDPATQ